MTNGRWGWKRAPKSALSHFISSNVLEDNCEESTNGTQKLQTLSKDKIEQRCRTLSPISTWVKFINILRAAFTRAGPKSTKKTDNLTVFFALLVPACVKAVFLGTLMKLKRWHGVNVVRWDIHAFIFKVKEHARSAIVQNKWQRLAKIVATCRQFHQCSTYSFNARGSQKRKKTLMI